MSEEVTHESVQEEMHRIYNDPAHPHHEGHKKGWPQSVAYVKGLYDRIPGGGNTVELGEGIEVGGPGDKQPPAPTEDATEAPAQDAEAWGQVVEGLRQEWGNATDANIENARGTALHLFGDERDLYDEAVQALGDDVLAIRLLHAIGRKLRS